MALNIPEIREALADAISGSLTGEGSTPNVFDYPPDSPELVAVCIVPRPGPNGEYVNYRGTFEGPQGALCELFLAVEIRCTGGEIDAARTLDKHLSVTDGMALFTALTTNISLSDLVESVYVGDCTVPAWFRAATDETRTWLAASYPLTIRVRR